MNGAATQIPDTILKTVSTGELISLILEYPLMPNLHAYQTVAEEDNALLTRVMEKVLITSAVSAAKAAPVTRAGVVIPMPTEPISNYPYPVTSYQVYTPSYRTAYVTLNTNIEMFPASQYASMIAQHQGAYLVSTASKTFNCHSYAWLSRHYPGAANDRFTNYQHMWLNSTSTFATDPFYVKLSSVISGAIADWSGHSGIITQTNIGYNNGIIDHMMISKWGPGPMVIHRVSDNPYYDRGDSVSYYTW